MADPAPYFRFLQETSYFHSLRDSPAKVSPDGQPLPEEPSTFLIETSSPMYVSQVRGRLAEVILTETGLSHELLDVEAQRPGDEDEPGIHFIADIMVDQFPNLTVHAEAALEFAEWLTETQDWIREARADIVWTGADTVSKFSNSSGGFCSEGAPSTDHDWQWGYKRIEAEAALNYSQRNGQLPGGADIKIGHIDTGFSAHIEVDGTYNPDTGYDLIRKRLPAADPMNYWGTAGHGGSTASVMVSRSPDKITGTAPAAMTVPYRAIKHVAVVTKMGRVAKAIYMAADAGCDVISMSLGGLSLFSGLNEALKYAIERDVILVAAAGNCVGIVVAPAASRNCIAVSGTRPDDKPWKYASYDWNDRVDIAGPAQWILAAAPKEGNMAYSKHGEGTSYATAMTAGAAALWLAFHGKANCVAAATRADLSLQEYFRLLLRQTADRPAGWDPGYGAGILNCLHLLKAGLPAAPAPTIPPAAKAGPDAHATSDRERFSQIRKNYSSGWPAT